MRSSLVRGTTITSADSSPFSRRMQESSNHGCRSTSAARNAFARPSGPDPPAPSDFGVLDRTDRTAIRANGITIVDAEHPAPVADFAFTSGRIAQTTFEKTL